MSQVALRQLAAWEKLAESWQEKVALDEEGVGRCGECGKGVLVWIDRLGNPYRYTHEQVLALTVLHLRNFHADLDPDKAGQGL